MLNNEFKKSATEKLKSMDSNEFKKAFKAIGSELQTNEEWFCQLPTGEKADFLANIYPKSVGEALIKISNGDKEKWEEWLKQPHKGE